MNKIKKLVREATGVWRVLSTRDFLRWVGLLIVCSPRVLRAGSLGPVDEAYGPCIRFRIGTQWQVVGNGSLGVVREIVAAHCYVRTEELRDARQILDLGANCGVFTLFALCSAPDARIVSVEAQPKMSEIAGANIKANGHFHRVLLHNAYAGEANSFIEGLRRDHPSLKRFDPEEYIAQVGHCDFLKCDIEGAEYTLITKSSTWLRKVRRMSLEYHGTWADCENLRRVVESHGFEVRQYRHGSLGYLMCQQNRHE